VLIAPGAPGAAGRQFRRLRADFGLESEALVRRVVWRVARRITPVIAVDRDGTRLFVSTDDWTLGRRLFCYRRVPQLDIARAFSVLRAIPELARAIEGRTVLEIGANIGSHTIEFIRRYGADSVVAIEPDPGNCALLRQNVLVNGIGEKTSLLPLAASDIDGTVELELSDTNPGDHRVRVVGASVDGASREPRTTIDVPAARLDSLLGDGRLDVESLGLVWMDVQGHEGHVLRGGRALLDRGLPIVTEYWPDGLRRAGGLEVFHALIAEHYRYVIDLRSREDAAPRVLGTDELPRLAREYGWDASAARVDPTTDLVLVRDLDPSSLL
jgi:FkbM family methyltransferase